MLATNVLCSQYRLKDKGVKATLLFLFWLPLKLINLSSLFNGCHGGGGFGRVDLYSFCQSHELALGGVMGTFVYVLG